VSDNYKPDSRDNRVAELKAATSVADVHANIVVSFGFDRSNYG